MEDKNVFVYHLEDLTYHLERNDELGKFLGLLRKRVFLSRGAWMQTVNRSYYEVKIT